MTEVQAASRFSPRHLEGEALSAITRGQLAVEGVGYLCRGSHECTSGGHHTRFITQDDLKPLQVVGVLDSPGYHVTEVHVL